ncbi:MAG: hypothetical protein EXR51_06545 [Dehalococcoidia bacterium]|nr:hypothetical protein [Dehalococcoidia bacterium]
MPTYEEEESRNLAAYDDLKDMIRSQYRGQYVAIADGRIMCVAPTIEEARASVTGFQHRLVFDAEAEVHRGTVWIR